MGLRPQLLKISQQPKMKKEFNVQKDLKNDHQLKKIAGKKSIQNKRRILLDPAYLTGCTDKGRIRLFHRNILGYYFFFNGNRQRRIMMKLI